VDIAFQTRRLERTFNSEMIAAANQYNPDYAVPPGWVLEEEIEARGISQSQFTRLCGLSAKLISEIIAGKAPIEPETAVQFDRVLGGGPDIWLRMESTYRLRLAQQKERLPRESQIRESDI
jgi:addiction module HigA family antidote